jgi:uncharacterized membrane protein YhaH (DUF805 family)
MNYFLDCYKKYAVFGGRARRSEYWYFALFLSIVLFLLEIISIVGLQASTQVGVVAGVLYIVFAIASLLPSWGVAVRRMHDVGKSGWFILIPIYNLVLACTAGDVGDNKYGPDPKAASNPA